MISSAFAAAAEHGAAVAHHGPFYTEAHFWVDVAFILVVALAFKPVSRAIAAALDARAAKIKARLDEAHKLREEAQEMLATYQRKQRDAMKEAEEIIAHAKAEAERLAQQAAKDLDASIKRREQMAMDRIAQAEAQAMKEVQNLAVDVAIGAAQKLIGESLSAAQTTSLVDTAIQALPGKLH
ncbi:F0F1 ATP synthase subunit B [Paramagnetospirillum kuznetsovii]|uniref:ATP synthase subunit b n=1 Tax=Paramagnetospirillum kuznetsovii TaxID=2053833 RepID=A0A364P0T1_9PROT|nr:F0F1 ATP synthase subunit B [Paramagnetospirillum kuznetsovii]RAU22952.1 F0F1 ATP synthase subunit B [Paramagnetospirillum kuznetsovii]